MVVDVRAVHHEVSVGVVLVLDDVVVGDDGKDLFDISFFVTLVVCAWCRCVASIEGSRRRGSLGGCPGPWGSGDAHELLLGGKDGICNTTLFEMLEVTRKLEVF